MFSALDSYLHQYNSISIPGIGTIYIERTPARTDFTNKQILPPGYHYRFDRFVDTPDKQFFAFIARIRDVADYEAIRLYNEWAQEMSLLLRTGSPVHWKGVGELRKNDLGDIEFTPEGPIPGYLSPVPANRIIRYNATHTMLVGDREVTNLQMCGYLHEGVKKRPANNQWIVYILAIVVIVGLIVFFALYNK